MTIFKRKPAAQPVPMPFERGTIVQHKMTGQPLMVLSWELDWIGGFQIGPTGKLNCRLTNYDVIAFWPEELKK